MLYSSGKVGLYDIFIISCELALQRYAVPREIKFPKTQNILRFSNFIICEFFGHRFTNVMYYVCSADTRRNSLIHVQDVLDASLPRLHQCFYVRFTIMMYQYEVFRFVECKSELFLLKSHHKEFG